MKSRGIILSIIASLLVFLGSLWWWQLRVIQKNNVLRTEDKLRDIKERLNSFFRINRRFPNMLEELAMHNKKQPLDLKDSWGNRFLYRVSSDLQRYAVVSLGRNARLETPIVDYVYRLPRQLPFDDIHDSSNDIVLANGCEIKFYSGSTQPCPYAEITYVVLLNLKDAIAIYFSINQSFPDHINSFSLKRQILATTQQNIELSGSDGWDNPVVYRVSETKTEYILASPGANGKFEYDLNVILAGNNIQKHRRSIETGNDDFIILNGNAISW